MEPKSKNLSLVSLIAVMVIAGVIVLTAVFFLPSAAPTGTNSSSKTVYFTIIESDSGAMEGMNGSAFHLSSVWPVITVQQGETVVIYLLNRNSSEPHGFSIFHYFNQGVALEPGASYTIKFVANEQGSFLITCPIFCSIHPLMDHGELIVESNSST